MAKDLTLALPLPLDSAVILLATMGLSLPGASRIQAVVWQPDDALSAGLQKPSLSRKYTMLLPMPLRAGSTVLVAGMPQPSSMLLALPSTELRSPIP